MKRVCVSLSTTLDCSSSSTAPLPAECRGASCCLSRAEQWPGPIRGEHCGHVIRVHQPQLTWTPITKLIEPKTKIGRTGWTVERSAMKGASMEPSLAIEHAKERAADLTNQRWALCPPITANPATILILWTNQRRVLRPADQWQLTWPRWGRARWCMCRRCPSRRPWCTCPPWPARLWATRAGTEIIA